MISSGAPPASCRPGAASGSSTARTYEEVLVVRVHPQLLEPQKLPHRLGAGDIWRQRFEDINAFERHLWRNGTIIRKFYLHVSRAEQKRRLLARLDDPAKNWKFSRTDVLERSQWNAYRTAYESALAATSHAHAPWYVIPSGHKWFAQALVADVLVEALEDLKLAPPTLTPAERRGLREARRLLLAEGAAPRG